MAPAEPSSRGADAEMRRAIDEQRGSSSSSSGVLGPAPRAADTAAAAPAEAHEPRRYAARARTATLLMA